MDPKERAKALNSGVSNPQKQNNTVDVPKKEEMVTMSKADLEKLLSDVRSDFEKRIAESDDRIEKLKLKYEKESAEKHIRTKGEYADKDLKIRQVGPLGPIDHQARSIDVAGVRDKLKGKRARFVSTNAELRSLRRSQGYEPVLDKEGNEVRYMDGTLMAMPADRYENEIAEPARVRKELHKRAITNRFREDAAAAGVEVIGDGIKYDGGDA